MIDPNPKQPDPLQSPPLTPAEVEAMGVTDGDRDRINHDDLLDTRPDWLKNEDEGWEALQ